MKGVISVITKAEVEESFSPRQTDFHSSHADPESFHSWGLFGLSWKEAMLLPELPGPLDWHTMICGPQFLTGALRISPELDPLDEEELVCFGSVPAQRARVGHGSGGSVGLVWQVMEKDAAWMGGGPWASTHTAQLAKL